MAVGMVKERQPGTVRKTRYFAAEAHSFAQKVQRHFPQSAQACG
jgi:hypothetical protein